MRVSKAERSQPAASFGNINDMYVVVSFHGSFGAWLGGQAFFLFFFLYLFIVFAKTKVNRTVKNKKGKNMKTKKDKTSA